MRDQGRRKIPPRHMVLYTIRGDVAPYYLKWVSDSRFHHTDTREVTPHRNGAGRQGIAGAAFRPVRPASGPLPACPPVSGPDPGCLQVEHPPGEPADSPTRPQITPSDADLIESGRAAVGGREGRASGPDQPQGLVAGPAGGVEFLAHVGEEEQLLRGRADGLGDSPVGIHFPLVPHAGVEVAGQERCQVTGDRVTVDEPLGVGRAR